MSAISRHRFVDRKPTWRLPHPVHVMEEAKALRDALDKLFLAEWMEKVVDRLLSEDDPVFIIKEAMLAEPMSLGLVSHYDAAAWTNDDFQGGERLLEEDEDKSRVLAKYIVSAAAMVGCAQVLESKRKYSYKSHVFSSMRPGAEPSFEMEIKPGDPNIYFQRSRFTLNYLLSLFGVCLDVREGLTIIAAARAHLISIEHGPRAYGDVRRVLSSLYDPDGKDEVPERTAKCMAWIAYSVARDDIIGDFAEQPDLIVMRAVERYNLLTEREIMVAKSILACMTGKFSDPYLPASLKCGDADVKRASYVDEQEAIPIVMWNGEQNTAGWFGPITCREDVIGAVNEIREKERPALFCPGEEELENTACFAISYKHENYGEPWRMDEERTSNFIELVSTVLSVLGSRPRVYLWMDRVFSMDVMSGDAEWSASTIEVYFKYPVLFVERDILSDSASIWLWVERVAALSGYGCIGNWLPLVQSTDSGIDAVFSRIDYVRNERICHLRALEKTSSPANRVANSILTANLNSKGMYDVSDFNLLISWALDNFRESLAEIGTGQDWISYSAPVTQIGYDLFDKPNLIRCRNSSISDSTDEVRAQCKEATHKELGLLRLQDGREYLADIIKTENQQYSLSAIVPKYAAGHGTPESSAPLSEFFPLSAIVPR